jgi:hypothetical protein
VAHIHTLNPEAPKIDQYSCIFITFGYLLLLSSLLYFKAFLYHFYFTKTTLASLCKVIEERKLNVFRYYKRKLIC